MSISSLRAALEKWGLQLNDDQDDEKDFGALEIDAYETCVVDPSDKVTAIGATTLQNSEYKLKFGFTPSTIHIGWAAKIEETGSIAHFGVILSGNTYTLLNLKQKKKASAQKYLLVHNCCGKILFEVCVNLQICLQRLAQGPWGEHAYKCKTDSIDLGAYGGAVGVVVDLVNTELKRKFDYKSAEHFEALSEYSNCMLFTFRVLRICKRDIPAAQKVLEKAEGFSSDDANKFTKAWNAYLVYAKKEY